MARDFAIGDNHFTLAGNPVEVGQKAPDFNLQGVDMGNITLDTYGGKTRILCSVPSLDTSVCDMEMKKFNERAANLDDTVVIAVSMDLPFAQGRWCGANGIKNVVTGSDHRRASFGDAYGCLLAEGTAERTLSRAVFVVGPDDTVRYVEYVPTIVTEPDYDAVLAAAGA